MIWDREVLSKNDDGEMDSFNLPLDLMRGVRSRAKRQQTSLVKFTAKMMSKALRDPNISMFFPPLPPDAVVNLKRDRGKMAPTRMKVSREILDQIERWKKRGYSKAYCMATLVKYGMVLAGYKISFGTGDEPAEEGADGAEVAAPDNDSGLATGWEGKEEPEHSDSRSNGFGQFEVGEIDEPLVSEDPVGVPIPAPSDADPHPGRDS